MDASNAWGCPGCVASLRDSLAALRPLLVEAAEKIANLTEHADTTDVEVRLRKAAEEEK